MLPSTSKGGSVFSSAIATLMFFGGASSVPVPGSLGSCNWRFCRVDFEQRRGRLAAHYAIGNLVGLALVPVARRAQPRRELDAPPLLHHVRRLVRGGVERGRPGEGHLAAGGEGLRAERPVGGLRLG